METSASNNSAIPFYALIAAAGSGVRMGSKTPKQYAKIGGKTVLRHSVEAFLACPGLQELRVIISPGHETLYQDSVSGLSLPPPVHGGKDRKESIYKGIESFFKVNNGAVLLIHDAARPFIKPAQIMAVAEAAQTHKAATLADPVADTLYHPEKGYVDRSGLQAIQTPQGFHYGLIRRAHEQARPDGVYTDDTSLVAALGEPITIVEGSCENFKITTQADWTMAERLMPGSQQCFPRESGDPEIINQRDSRLRGKSSSGWMKIFRKKNTHTGMGYDVHAFGAGSSVRLGGVDIPFDKSLSGHSDADVVLHAITDALLGAIGGGDIGQHFPPSDPQWKGVDSAVFLKKAVEMVDGNIINLDVTVICEAPKIGPHREAMQKRIAEICGIDPAQVNIKATTTEGLGFTGRGEGIAAQAVASVELAA